MSAHRLSITLLMLNLLAGVAFLSLPRLAASQDEPPKHYYQPCCASGKEANYCCIDCCTKKTCSGAKGSNKDCGTKAT
jgi:hypothetical protein